MDKLTKKRASYNLEVLELLKKQYGFSINYIQKCLRGDRVGIIPDNIINDYNTYNKASQKAIENQSFELVGRKPLNQ